MPEVILRTTTRLVQVNVIVTRKGAPVPGLKKEDFQVFDNGKQQEIRQFSVDTRALLPSVAAPLPKGTFTNQLEQRSGAPAAVTVILLDGVNTHFSDRAYAREQVMRFLKQIQPEDRIAIYTLDRRGLRVLHDYTRDSADIVATLANDRGDLLGGWLGSGGNRAWVLNDRILATLHSIEFIADNLAPLPGRKNLIWVSSAFPLQIGYSVGSRGQNWNWNAEADRAIRALNNANLAIYPVDARGLIGHPLGDASQSSAPRRTALMNYSSQATMEELAGRTGGRAFINTNDIAGAIRTAVEDSSVTYTLGFYPQNDKFDNSFHNLKVKVVDASHVELRYRKGYLDQSTPPQDEGQRRAALHDAVISPIDANGIGLRASVHQTSAGFDLTLRVDPKSIQLDPQGDRWAGKLDLLFVEKDAHGTQTFGVDDTLSLELRKQNYDRVQQEGLMYHRLLPRTGEAAEIRIIVRDASTGALGSITAASEAIPNP
jgi:VWFA-related protein